MLPGVTITIGECEWIVPPLTLGQLRRLMPKVRQLSVIDTQMGDTEIAIVVEIVTAALQRNYPDVTADEVENILDLANAGRVLSAVLTGSGLKAGTTPGEAEAPGRGLGAQPISTNGNRSTACSPPPADTAIR